MFEALENSLDYFDNEGNNKLEQKLRAFISELNADMIRAGYIPPKNVSEAYVELNSTLEDVIDFVEDNDLDEDEILGIPDNEDEDDDIIEVISEDDIQKAKDEEDEDDEFDEDGNPKEK